MRATDSEPFAATEIDRFHLYGARTPEVKERMESRTAISWPQLEFYHPGAAHRPGPLFLTGPRPDINMMAFVRLLGEVCRELGVRHIVNMTSGYGNSVHTRPVVISALGNGEDEPGGEVDRETRRMKDLVNPQEGTWPLEDAGMLQAALTGGVGYLAVCGHVPGYLSFAPDQRVAAELARRVRDAAGLEVSLERAEEEARDFTERLEWLTERDPMLQMMTRSAEAHEDQALRRAEELAPGDEGAMSDDIERFLRQERESNGQ